MGLRRSFHDPHGVSWSVFAVHPSDPSFFQVLTEYRDGWLVFVSATDRRRLAPCPAGWESRGEDSLIDLLAKAVGGDGSPHPGHASDPVSAETDAAAVARRG